MVESNDLANAGNDALGQLKAALDQHLVLYLPGQSLDRFQLAEIGRYFCSPFLHPLVNNGFADCPEYKIFWLECRPCLRFTGTCGARNRSGLRPSPWCAPAP